LLAGHVAVAVGFRPITANSLVSQPARAAMRAVVCILQVAIEMRLGIV